MGPSEKCGKDENAPEIVAPILNGAQPVDFTARKLSRASLSYSQGRNIGRPASGCYSTSPSAKRPNRPIWSLSVARSNCCSISATMPRSTRAIRSTGSEPPSPTREAIKLAKVSSVRNLAYSSAFSVTNPKQIA